jgi:hypothetical protein
MRRESSRCFRRIRSSSLFRFIRSFSYTGTESGLLARELRGGSPEAEAYAATLFERTSGSDPFRRAVARSGRSGTRETY